MAEKVVIGNAELWHGDCREILPAVAAGSIVTSPPYGVGKEYERGGRLEWLALMSGFFAATDAEIVVLNLADVRCHEDKLIAPVRADVVGRKNAVTAQDVIDAAIAGRGRNKKEIAEALRADALRYRWLRNHVIFGYPSSEGSSNKAAYLVVTE